MAGRTDKFDWISFLIYISLLAIGWFMLYAVSQKQFETAGIGLNDTITRQSAWIGLSLLAFLIGQIIDSRFWRTFSFPIYAISLLMLLFVLVFGIEVKGARSWIGIAGYTFQPGEIVKFTSILAVSGFIVHYGTDFKSLRSQAIAVSLVILPAFLIILQPDAGTALSFASLFILLYRQGMPTTYYLAGAFLIAVLIMGLLVNIETAPLFVLSLAVFAIFSGLKNLGFWRSIPFALLIINIVHLYFINLAPWIVPGNLVVFLFTLYLAWSNRQRSVLVALPLLVALGISLSFLSGYLFNNVLQPHQQDRINVWLQPDKCDPQGALYNVIQSKVAIGSGGFAGKGFLQGTMTRLNFVPEQSTDFIFSTIGEEQGFIGSLFVIALFFGLIFRCLQLAEAHSNSFVRGVGYGFAGFLFFHVFVNIGMTMGLVPIIGIPLPFISKGGTALLSFSIMLSVFLKMVRSMR